MNKELLISIKPEHLVNILNGKKTLELRKTVPKDYKGWVNIYCTKNKKMFRVLSLGFYEDVLYKLPNGQIKFGFPYEEEKKTFLNGKVVARFWFDEYDSYCYGDVSYPDGYEDFDGTFVDTTKYTEGYYVYNEDLERLCLTYEEVEEYGKGKDLYAWHIKQLEIFDKPKELSEFIVGLNYLGDIISPTYKKLKKAPTNYTYIYTKELEK